MNIVKLNHCLGFILLIVMWACQPHTDVDLVEKDLLSYGIPITIKMPDSAEINMMDWGVQKDLTISEDWYNLQIFSSKALTHDLSKLKNNKLQEVKSNPYFSQIIQEDPDGFIFEIKLDSLLNYDFRHFKIQGDNEYSFQAGMVGERSLEEVERLYQIVREAR